MDYCNSKPTRAGLVSPLARLIERGDRVEVLKGRLSITPKSGLPVPDGWIKEHERELILDMANLTNQLYLSYTAFDCGYYTKHKAGGLNLRLTNMANNRASYTIFNVGLTRSRNTKKHKAGTRLPKGQFTVTDKQGLYLFWLTTGLKMPDRPNSRLWGYMGNLSAIHFTGRYDPTDTKQEKILTKSFEPLNVSHEALINTGLFIHKPCTPDTQATHNAYTKPIHKETDQTHSGQALQAAIGTGLNNCGKRLQGNEVTRKQDKPPNNPNKQTNEEWIAEYLDEAINPTFHLSNTNQKSGVYS